MVKIRSGRDVKDLSRRNGEPAIVIAAEPSVQKMLYELKIESFSIILYQIAKASETMLANIFTDAS